MTKKIVSFIIIFLMYSFIAAAVIDLSGNYGYGFGEKPQSEIRYAYAMDHAGNIFFAQDDGEEKSLVSLDSSGKKLFEKKLDSERFGSDFYVSDIFIAYDKNIYVSVYACDQNSGMITGASIHKFYEDGSYACEIFKSRVSVYPNARANIISPLTEYEECVQFAYMDGQTAKIFLMQPERAALNSEYQIEDSTVSETYTTSAAEVFECTIKDTVYGFVTLSPLSIAAGTDKGIKIYDPTGERLIKPADGAVFDRFWDGIDDYSFYAEDSINGDIICISTDPSAPVHVRSHIGGEKEILPDKKLVLRDMDDVAVSPTGMILAVWRGEDGDIYKGTASFMTKISLEGSESGELITVILLDSATIIAVVLLTILTWDFFRTILKMRMSVMLRQSLLTITAIVAVLYIMIYHLVIPRVTDMIVGSRTEEAKTVTATFETGIKGIAGTNDYGAYSDYLENFAGAAELSSKLKPSVNLLEYTSDRLIVTASGEFYPYGYPADKLALDFNMTKAIWELESSGDTERIKTSLSERGQKLFVLRKIDLPVTENSTYILVSVETSSIGEVNREIRGMFLLVFAAGVVIPAALFMAVENITASSVRRLKKSVDRIARGEYNAEIHVNTGDEVEELAFSVKDLSRHIIEKTVRLESLNSSYYRFVPQSFLENLGENQIEKVGKSLYVKKQMAILTLRFDFSQPFSGMEATEIFGNINSVYEQIMPVIDEYEGTAYNFLFDGLSVIFGGNPESALRAAIRIREVAAAYNEIQTAKSGRTVRIRAVISEDEVLLGFIGDDQRMEPTVVSTAINRSEEIEKILPDSSLFIVCTEEAYSSLPRGKYRSRYIGKFSASDGVCGLYDMFDGDPYSMIKLKERFSTRFELGVRLFEKGDFVNARNTFMDIVKYAPEDGVSRNYMYLSEHNITAENKRKTYTIYSDF